MKKAGSDDPAFLSGGAALTRPADYLRSVGLISAAPSGTVRYSGESARHVNQLVFPGTGNTAESVALNGNVA